MNVYRQLLARIGAVLLLAGAFVAVSVARAEATLIVWVCNDAACSGESAITDNGAGDTNATVGVITSSGFMVSETATSYPAVGSPTQPYLNLTYSVTDEGFTLLGTPFIYATQDSFLAAGTAGFQADASNGSGTASLFSGSGLFTPATAGAPLINCVLDCVGAAVITDTPYYLALLVAPTAGFAGAASGDVTVVVQSVPDGGATATLFGSVLLGVGLLRRKFSQN